MRFRLSLLLLLFGALLGGLLLSGCWTVSLHPLYSEGTLTYDERLLGTWKHEGTTAVFTRATADGYVVQYTADNMTSRLAARLVKLGEHRYLDISSASKDDFDAAEAHRVYTHSFWKVALEGDRLRLTPLDFDWLRGLLDKDPKAISATRMEKDFIVLTASTEELQQFVLRYGDRAFKTEGVDVFQREVAPAK